MFTSAFGHGRLAAASLLFATLSLSTAACKRPSPPPAEDRPSPPKSETLEERAARIHKEAIVVDTHNDITSMMLATKVDLADPEAQKKIPQLHTDIRRMKAGGITGEFFSIYVDKELAAKPSSVTGGSARRALDLIDLVYQQAERHPADFMMATSADDIRRAKKDGKIACLMGIEGGHAIENSLSALRDFYRLGVRYMTLTHTNTNDWADSSGSVGPPVVRHHGLSPFGERVVTEMQRIGMLVDISHVSDETFDDVIRIAKAPIIASHSSARALANHRRNMSDDMLRALAQNGGVVMINFWPVFLDEKYAAAFGAFNDAHKKEYEALRAKYLDTDPLRFFREVDEMSKKDPRPPLPFSVLIDHIEHAIKVAGIDHVGLGSDFDGVESLPEGMTGIDGLPKITLELLKRGHSEEDVKKVLGENFLRAFSRAEAFSKQAGKNVSGEGDTSTMPTPAEARDAGTK
jgi:membrane dipeptidase